MKFQQKSWINIWCIIYVDDLFNSFLLITKLQEIMPKKEEKKMFVKLHNILFYLGKGLGGFEAETISETNKHC